MIFFLKILQRFQTNHFTYLSVGLVLPLFMLGRTLSCLSEVEKNVVIKTIINTSFDTTLQIELNTALSIIMFSFVVEEAVDKFRLMII